MSNIVNFSDYRRNKRIEPQPRADDIGDSIALISENIGSLPIFEFIRRAHEIRDRRISDAAK